MDQILKERDRLLQRIARAFGLSFTAVATACLLAPGSLQPGTLALVLPLLAILAFAQYRMGVGHSLAWIAVVLATGTATLFVVVTIDAATPNPGAAVGLGILMSFSLASVALVLATGRYRIPVLAVVVLALGIVTIVLMLPWRPAVHSAAFYAVGWSSMTLIGAWIVAAVPQVGRRIASIGRAHRAERHASELEAQRRQNARLLHDTVLATLTLLAHSGVGVAPAALQQQAGEDARLLRQLRLGASPAPDRSGQYNLEPVEETVLGTTLESVKQRFGRMGLEVSWHGTGQVLLPSDVLDAFLLALAECLENVRRHSGVTEAHVTIVDDATTVRAMVTDAGVGFVLDDVDSARLGFKESVVARLKEVGGQARLFSSPGSGTTVVLEVPR